MRNACIVSACYTLARASQPSVSALAKCLTTVVGLSICVVDRAAKQLSLAADPLGKGAALTPKEERRELKRAAKALKRLQANPAEASVDDVCDWLGSLDLAVHAATFREHSIDGAALLELDDAQLRDDLEILKMGERAKLSREIGSLQASTTGSSTTDINNTDVLPGSSTQLSSGASATKRIQQQGRRGAPPPPPPTSGTRVKISARWGPGGDWVHVKMDADEINLQAVKQRLATTMQLSPLAFSYMQYQDAQGDW